MHSPRIAVIGAGVAGLVAAADLARAGFTVLLFERAATPGGKMRQVSIDGRAMDAGPTVFTLRRVFDELFDDAGDSFERRVKLTSANLLARHAWNSDQRLDLFADVEQSAHAIGEFAGQRDAQGFRRFVAQARRVYETLDRPFMRAARPTPFTLMRRVGLARAGDLLNIQPFVSLWRTMGGFFKDPRLRQLFARYATYCGSSPFVSPATLMLVAHVEQAGVCYLEGGMHELAVQLAALATRQGATLRYACEIARLQLHRGRVAAVQTQHGERIPVDAVICNADNNALAAGLFGAEVRGAVRSTAPPARSLSAITWNLLARTEGFELAHHSVFFSADYRAEFVDIFQRRRLPSAPTIYICAQDRCDAGTATAQPNERLLCLVNAPPIGDTHFFDTAEIDTCKARVLRTLLNCGLKLHPQGGEVTTTPTDFNRMFPGTGGALYGPASHGWMASFKRAGSRSAIPGLYLAGGSTHPGPGVPMAATSGRLAAACVGTDFASILGFHPVAISGGMSTR
jgi:1-hydroxycarotenoid 3,4-desaturase